MSEALQQIIKDYQAAIIENPLDANAHHHLAMFYMKNDDYFLSLKHFQSAINAAPNFVLAYYHLSLLLIKNHETAAAMTQLKHTLALDPYHISARFYLSTMQIQANQLNDAEKNLRLILQMDSEHVPALINLGVIALKQDAHQTAINYFTHALALDEHNIEARNNLAATFMHNDRFENALTYYNELLKTDPLNTEYLYNMGVANMALGKLLLASQQFEAVLEQISKHVASLHNLAAIKIRQGQRQEAINFLQKILVINPHDSSSKFMLDTITGKNQTPDASNDYVKHLFNNYALHYESHLQNVLEYNLPQKVVAMLRQYNYHTFDKVLDLGCGTGLSGVPLREYTQELIGVDLSPKMLTQARNKNLYNQLIESDILSFLKQTDTYYSLILAIDVLPYFGSLEALFTALMSRLDKNGVLVISTEISDTQPWFVQDSMRFCHHPEYIKQLVHQLNGIIVSQTSMTARKENEQDLPVMCYLITGIALSQSEPRTC